MPAVEMMHETIWFDQPEFEEAECHYHLYLASKNAPSSIAAAKVRPILLNYVLCGAPRSWAVMGIVI